MQDVDDYLVKALNELRRRTTQDTGADGAPYDPTNFYSSTLEELTKRIALEKRLKEEMAQVKEVQVQRCFIQDIDDYLVKTLNELRRRIAQDTGADGAPYDPTNFYSSTLEELTKRITLEKRFKEEMAQEKEEVLIEQRNTASQKEQENLRLIQQLQVSQAELQDQIHRLNADNVLQAHRLRELDDTHQELLREIDKLKRQRPGSQKPPPGQTSDAETKSLGNKKTEYLESEILRFPGTSPKSQHSNDQHVIVLSSDEDEMPVAINRRRLGNRTDPTLSISKEKDDGNHDCRSSDDEGLDELEDGVDGDHENPETVSERRLSTGLPSLQRNLPLSRRFNSAPLNLENVPDLETTTIFNRQHLHTYLGGGLMVLQVRIGKQKSVAKRFGITSFMCPNLDHNPWAPCHPGQDGYIFVGLGNEEGAFEFREIHELFIQFAPKKMFYAGRYSFQKVDDLTIEEWKCVPTKVKHKYCETTIHKTKQGGPVEAALSAYDEGRLRAPCVLVRFLHFDLPLYKTLSNAGQPIRPTVSTTSASQSHQGEKRKHDRDGTESITTPKRVKQKGLEPSTPNDVYDSDLGHIYA